MSGAALDWSREFDQALALFAEAGEPFTSEDVTDLVGLPNPSEPNANNAVGIRIRHAARRGLIRKTGRIVPARRARSNGREVREWVGAIA